MEDTFSAEPGGYQPRERLQELHLDESGPTAANPIGDDREADDECSSGQMGLDDIECGAHIFALRAVADLVGFLAARSLERPDSPAHGRAVRMDSFGLRRSAVRLAE